MEQQRIYSGTGYRAAIYCRLSKDDEQAGESISIGTQKSMLESYCREQGFLVYDYYVDDGYSGLNFNRPGFERMLNDIDNGKVNLVITKDLSRLGRDYIQTGYYTEVYFSRKHVRYIALNDRFDSMRDDNDIAPFKNILNDMYAKDLSRKVKAAKRQRAKNGFFISAQAPYGYKPNPHNRNQLIVDEEAANVVKKIFALALSGYGAVKIAKALKAERIINPSAYKAKNGDTRFSRYNDNQNPNKVYEWCYATIQIILQDRVYTGDMVNHKCEIVNYKTKERQTLPKEQYIIVPNTHEPLVSREDFEQVQMLIKSRPSPTIYETENLFRGVLVCSECGHSLSMAHRRDKRAYYRCMHHYRHPDECLHTHAIFYDDLYKVVLERIRATARLLQDDEAFYRLVEEKSGINTSDKQLATERDKLKRRQQELSTLLFKLFEDHAAGLISDENYVAFTNRYQSEQTEIQEKIVLLDSKLEQQRDYQANAEQLREAISAYLNIDSLTPFILNKLIENIQVGHAETINGQTVQEITIVWRFAGEVNSVKCSC
ncbi:MAG TPA: recombinase family protein [Bacilli bacterium]|jgi:site-specific DNA recombinase|nr:recombinase family protein [Bacilli bacterium]